MKNDDTRLVLRRTTEGIGSEVVVRLNSTVSRSADLYSLFREGFVVEVIDVETSVDGKPPLVTIGLRADQAFIFDRMENAITPRNEKEIGAQPVLAIDVMDGAVLRDKSLDSLEDLMVILKGKQIALSKQVSLLKHDKSIASDHGYRHPSNVNHDRWLLIKFELITLAEQLELAKLSLSQLSEAIKSKRRALSQKSHDEFKSQFVKLAKQTLSPEEFSRLSAAAEESTKARAA